MTSFTPDGVEQRAAATTFVGRIAQLDPAALIRLTADRASVDLWAKAGFGVMAQLRVRGSIDPDPLTAYATNLVAGLAVSTADRIDTGTDAADQWFGQLPPTDGWTPIGQLPGSRIAELVAEALPQAQDAVEFERAEELRAKTKATVPPAVLDRALATVDTATGTVPISMRMLFALSGMGFVDPDEAVGVSVTATWLRLETPDGIVARRRMADLPLV